MVCLLFSALSVTPPGYKTTITGDSGTTDPCQDGEYRPEWKPAVAAATCLSCGAGIYSSPIEQITRYAATPDATPMNVDVRAGPASCCEYTDLAAGFLAVPGWFADSAPLETQFPGRDNQLAEVASMHLRTMNLVPAMTPTSQQLGDNTNIFQ